MALITAGSVVGQVSGRLASVVYTRNKGGSCVRNGSIPTNPRSYMQRLLRRALASRSQEWAGLTDAERAAWRLWARSNPVVNRLGRAVQMTGAQAYTSCNLLKGAYGLPVNRVPSLTAPPDSLQSVAMDVDFGLSKFDVVFSPSPLPVTGFLLLSAYVGYRPGSMAVENRLRISGASSIAQASPWGIQTALEDTFGVLQVGQVVTVRVSVFGWQTGKFSSALQSRAVIA